MFYWPVVPICEAQQLDVAAEDLILMGTYRRCKTYKAGGGYDQFPTIFRKRWPGEWEGLEEQFVVQLKGCTLECPYCYVTKTGVNGMPTRIQTNEMVRTFEWSKCGVFHLMGGAPAIYIEHWPELLECLDGRPFHSDFILNEKPYDVNVLRQIAEYPNQLHAVSIKGEDALAYQYKTHTAVDFPMMMDNLEKLVNCGVPFYVTFTGMSELAIEEFKNSVGKDIFEDSFAIEVRDYDALHWDD